MVEEALSCTFLPEGTGLNKNEEIILTYLLKKGFIPDWQIARATGLNLNLVEKTIKRLSSRMLLITKDHEACLNSNGRQKIKEIITSKKNKNNAKT